MSNLIYFFILVSGNLRNPIADFTEHHELRCEPLPDLGKPKDRTLWVGEAGPELNRSIADKFAKQRLIARVGPVKGVRAVLAEDPSRSIPKKLEPLPLCSTVNPDIKRKFMGRRKAYVSSYYFAKGLMIRHRDTRPFAELMELFPPGSCVGHAGWRKVDD